MSATTTRRRTQAERIEASEEAMYKAAIKLIAREGPSKMTLAGLGKEAGVSPGLVNHRYGTKRKMLEIVAMKALNSWSRVALESTKENPETGIKALEWIGRRYINTFITKSDLSLAQSRLITESYSAYPELQPAVQEYNRQVRQLVVDILQPAKDTGEIKADLNLDTFSVMYLGMLRGIGTQYLVDDDLDINDAYEMLCCTCRQLLANP